MIQWSQLLIYVAIAVISALITAAVMWFLSRAAASRQKKEIVDYTYYYKRKLDTYGILIELVTKTFNELLYGIKSFQHSIQGVYGEDFVSFLGSLYTSISNYMLKNSLYISRPVAKQLSAIIQNIVHMAVETKEGKPLAKKYSELLIDELLTVHLVAQREIRCEDLIDMADLQKLMDIKAHINIEAMIQK